MNTLAGNPRLKGGRKKKGPPTQACPQCFGEGYMNEVNIYRSTIREVPCDFCKGTGKVPVPTNKNQR